MCTNTPDPRRDSDAGPCYAFIDLGWSHDESVLAITKLDPDGKVAVVALETWRGTKEHPVVLAQVRARTEKLIVDLGVVSVTIESPQGLSLQQELSTPRTCKTSILYPTALSNRERFGCLYRLTHDDRIRLPHDDLLRRQLLGMSVVSTTSGWHVEDSPSIHNDRVVAVAGAAFDATEGRPSRWRHIPFAALVGDGVAVVSREGKLVALVDDDAQAFRALGEPRKVRIRQLALNGVRPETLRVQFSISRPVLAMVLDEVGYRIPDPESLAGQQ